ncbi:MAG: hypothetical protein ACRYFS_15970 [Janthinobacterium lividum]
MAQSFPPTDPDSPRPLPRRAAPRPSLSARPNRPRFQALDAVWIGVLCLVSLALSGRLEDLTGHRLGGSIAAAGTVGALYLLGWRARDRAAGISAGLLAALSPQFLHLAAYSPQSAPFALLTVAALFAFVAGSSLAALALAAAAAIVRPDGILLGLLLLGLSLAQHRKRSGYGALIFFVPVVAYGIGRSLLGFGHSQFPVIGLHGGVWHWLWTPASALLVWLLLPFCGELSEPLRRTRWLPVILWTLVSLVSLSVQSVTTPIGMLLPLLPLLFALAGGGLSRLVPILAGEFPSPALRYALATLAVLTLVGLHMRLEPHF